MPSIYPEVDVEQDPVFRQLSQSGNLSRRTPSARRIETIPTQDTQNELDTPYEEPTTPNPQLSTFNPSNRSTEASEVPKEGLSRRHKGTELDSVEDSLSAIFAAGRLERREERA